MATMLKSTKNVNLIEFKNGVKTEKINDTVLIMQSIIPYSIRDELNVSSSTKLVFWTLFHYNLIPSFMPIDGLRNIHHNSKIFKKIYYYLNKSFYDIFLEFIINLQKKSSLFFMDSSTFFITNNFLSLDISKPKILPICVDLSKKEKRISRENSINICWVGRIEDFKTSILNFCLLEAYSFANKTKYKINFHIVGYGKDKNRIKSSTKKNQYFTPFFVDSMDVNSTKNFLLKNIDMVMSMGTAALDSGKLGIPTVLLDASYKKIPKNYKFKWLYESDGSNVARFIENKEFENNNHSIDQIIYAYFKESDYLGLKCREYVEKNHSTKVVAENLLKYTDSSQFTWGEINDKLLKKSFFRKVYEKKRNKNI